MYLIEQLVMVIMHFKSLKLVNKDDSFLSEKKNQHQLGEHLKKIAPNLDLQFIHKESGNSMTTAK